MTADERLISFAADRIRAVQQSAMARAETTGVLDQRELDLIAARECFAIYAAAVIEAEIGPEPRKAGG